MSYSRRSEIYDIEYNEIRDIDFVTSLVMQFAGNVLEMPCGAGRLSRRIADKANSLTIIDLEPEMMSRALETIHSAHPLAKVTGVVQDIRHLSVDGIFDLVIIPREALQLFPPEESADIISNVAGKVATGGCLFLDISVFGRNATKCSDVDYYFPDHIDGVWYENWSRALSNNTTLTRSSTQWHNADSIRFDLKYDVKLGANVIESWASQMRLYYYDRSWFDKTIPAGMSLEHVYGCYNKSPFSNTSYRLISIYRKLN